MSNIIEIFRRNAISFATTAALVDGGRAVTFAALAADVRRVARRLEREGIRPGDHVLLFVPMSRELYTLLLALFHIGAVAVFVDAWADRRRLALAAGLVPLRAFIGTRRAHALRLLSRDIRAIPIKLVARTDSWRADGVEPAVHAAAPGDAALVTFTTGSTGAPRGARRTHRFLVAQHRSILASFDTRHGDIDLPMLPIFVLNNLAAGATTVLPAVDPRRVDEFDPEVVVGQITREGVATTTGSPAFYARLAEHCIAHDVRLPSLRRIFLGGAPVGRRLARRLIEAFPATEITIVYGSTEAEPVSMIDAREMLDRVDRHEGLPVGFPVRAIDLVIVPITDGAISVASEQELRALALPAGVTGEICVAGEHVLEEYYGDRASWMASKIDVGGRLWHRTGDGGYRDTEGALYLMGRVRQSFERRGERVFVLPIEEQVAAIDGVASGTILLIDERSVLVIEPAAGADRRAIERAARDAVGGFDDVRFIDAMPRDPRHRSKIDYERLRAMVGINQH